MKTLKFASTVLIPILLAAAGVYLCWSGIRGFQALGERRQWPKIKATIVEDRIDHTALQSRYGKDMQALHSLRLRYQIAGLDREGELELTEADLRLQNSSGAVGESITILYNPLKPQQLQVQSDFWPGPKLGIGVTSVVLSFAFIVSAIQKREISGRR